jgi:hypothetical protein
VALAAVYALLGAVNAFAGPIGMVCTNGPNFSLKTATGHIETPDGNSVFMWSYANASGSFQVPSPVLCVNQGATVTVALTNSLPEPTSIVFPGQAGVSATGTGVSAGLLGAEVAPGGTITYSFVASNPGTYLFESGSAPEKQVEMGLYGVLVVRPTGHPDWAYGSSSTRFDPSREYLQVFHEIDPALHHSVEIGGAYAFTMFHPRYWTVNGRSFPDTIQNNATSWLPTQPYGALVRVKPYDPVKNPLPALVRIVNAGLVSHPFHPHGYHVKVIAQDGRLFPDAAWSERFGDVVPPGAAQDSLFKFVDVDKFCAGQACTAAGWAQKPLPLTLPSYRNLTFKDNKTWYSGSPYLGAKGTLPTLVVSYNLCGEFYFPWHSHALNEFVNYDEGFGGLATLLRVDPLVGCTAFPTATNLLATPPNTTSSGTAGGGSFADLSEAGDVSYYVVNSTATATPTTSPAGNSFKADWSAGHTGVAAGSQNLNVTYKGYCSSTTSTAAVSCQQLIFIWSWRTSSWTSLGPASTITAETTTTVDVTASPSAGKWSDYIGAGANAGVVKVRVFNYRASAGGAAFKSRGNFMKLVYDAP